MMKEGALENGQGIEGLEADSMLLHEKVHSSETCFSLS